VPEIAEREAAGVEPAFIHNNLGGRRESSALSKTFASRQWATKKTQPVVRLPCPWRVSVVKKWRSSLSHMCHPYAGAMLIFSLFRVSNAGFVTYVFFQFDYKPPPEGGALRRSEPNYLNGSRRNCNVQMEYHMRSIVS
jgi:hypothetical protein